MAYGVSNGHVTLNGQTRDPNTLRAAQYLENGWRQSDSVPKDYQ